MIKIENTLVCSADRQVIRNLLDEYRTYLDDTYKEYNAIKYKQSKKAYYLFALIQAYDGIVIKLENALK